MLGEYLCDCALLSLEAVGEDAASCAAIESVVKYIYIYRRTPFVGFFQVLEAVLFGRLCVMSAISINLCN